MINQDRPPNFRDEKGNLYLVRCYACALKLAITLAIYGIGTATAAVITYFTDPMPEKYFQALMLMGLANLLVWIARHD